MRVLVVNTGSSSLKLRLLEPTGRLHGGTELERWSGADDVDPIERFLATAGQVDVVGHRVVHGGARFRSQVLLDDEIVTALKDLTDLAPLHQPRSLAGIEAVQRVLPDVPSVACFDTAFHATIPEAAATYALPNDWRRRWGLRRYGFHGLSHSYAARRAAELVGRPVTDLRTVTCHLGAGASLCAVVRGESVDTTMGFTPLEGLVMATRSGTVDPGLLLWVQQNAGINVDDLSDALEHASGLAGMSGTSGDLRDVLARADSGDADAALAFAVYIHRLRGFIAAMAAAAGGLDVLVFTGGVGEHQPVVRAGAAEGLGFLGVGVEADANERADADADITAAGSPVRTLVIAAREDIEIARQVATVVQPGSEASVRD